MAKPNSAEQRIDVKVYIEGIQVPFVEVTVHNTRGSLPRATLTLPPLPGLNDIGRYYMPKVHVFFLDLDFDRSSGDPKHSDYQLLFTGIIASTGYNRSRGLGASASMSFSCLHKNTVMDGITFAYTGRGVESLTDIDTVAKAASTNSRFTLIQSLKGIDKDTAPISPEVTDTENTKSLLSVLKGDNNEAYFTRLQGMPGVLVNYWNQVKRDVYLVKSLDPETMTDMYIPLMEEGIQFFQRLSGHHSLESVVDSTRGSLPEVDEALNTEEEENSKTLTPDYLSKKEYLIPPSLRESIGDAVGTHIGTTLMQMGAGFSGEQGNVPSMLTNIAATLQYEVLTLGSPVATTDGLPAVEVLFKPYTDFYYSPKCNVITHNMHDSIQVTENTWGAPTRVVCVHRIQSTDSMALRYRGPQSVREAIAGSTGDLSSTTISSRDKVGRYEWGRGLNPVSIGVPAWMQYLHYGANSHNDITPLSETRTDQAPTIVDTFQDQYGPGYPDRLIPWSDKSNLNPYQRLLIAGVDQVYAQRSSGMRSGGVSGVFNPYAVVGYPMDVLGPDESSPSYHSICESVSHTITDRSINTSYQMSNVMTFEEMYSYYLPSVSPWLTTQLGLDTRNSIIDNEAGIEKANAFYYSALKVGCAPLENIHDYSTGRPNAIEKGADNGHFTDYDKGFESVLGADGMEGNPNLSVKGSLTLVKRPIESMQDYEDTFGVTFVDIEETDYSPSSTKDTVGIPSSKVDSLEPGQSPYLDYDDEQSFAIVADAGSGNSPTEKITTENSKNFLEVVSPNR